MGASHSGDGSTKTRKAYGNSLKHFRKNHLQENKEKKFLKWKNYLTELLMHSDTAAPSDWNVFKEALLQHVSDEKEDNSIWWIANLQRLPLSFSTYLSQFPKDVVVLECDSLEEEKTNRQPSIKTLNTSPITKNGSMNSAIFDSIKGSPTLKSLTGSRMVPSCLSKKSAKQELKFSLSNQVNNPNHIVYRLVQKFIGLFDMAVKGYIGLIEGQRFTEELEQIYNNGKSFIKHFTRIQSKFIIWVYVDFIKQFVPGLNQEDFNPSAVVEDVIYQMLFETSTSSPYKFVISILEVKYANKLRTYKENLRNMNELRLEDYDKNLEGTLLDLEGTTHMYGRVIKKLRHMKKEVSPYNKYETIVSLDQELSTYLQNHYKNDYEIVQKVEELLGRDAKTAIVTYCIAKSLNENLLVDRAFIEEFVDPDCLGATPHFPAFHGYVEHILLRQNHVEGNNRKE